MSSFFQKMKYAVDSAKDLTTDVIEGEKVFLAKDEVKVRMDICSGCEYFVKSLSRCNECGCFQKIKTNLKSSKCPIGKW